MQGIEVSPEDIELIYALSDYRDSIMVDIKKKQAEFKTLRNIDIGDKFELSRTTINELLKRRRVEK